MSISRRGFVSHAAAAGAGGVLSNLLDGRTESLQAETTSFPNTKLSPIPTRPFGKTGAEISIVGFGAGSRFYTSTPDDETGAELIRAAVDRRITLVETGKGTSAREMTSTGAWSERDPQEASVEQGRAETNNFIDAAVQFIERWKTLRPMEQR